MSIERKLALAERAIDAKVAEPKAKERLAKNHPFLFAISLKSARLSNDWGQVQANLAATLRTVIAQTYPNVSAIVCGNERPDIPELSHPRVRWLDSPDPIADKPTGNDKRAKRRAIGVDLRRSHYAGHVMGLDADDWLHRRFVEYAVALAGRRSIILSGGIVYSAEERKGWLRSKATQPFYDSSGSSGAIWFNPTDFPAATSKQATAASRFNLALGPHAKLIDALREEGKNPVVIDRPMAVWFIGHGDNAVTQSLGYPVPTAPEGAEPLPASFAAAFPTGLPLPYAPPGRSKPPLLRRVRALVARVVRGSRSRRSAAARGR